MQQLYSFSVILVLEEFCYSSLEDQEAKLQTVICQKVHSMLLYLFYIVQHILILISVISSKILNYLFESINHFTKTYLCPLIDIKRYPLFVQHNESL